MERKRKTKDPCSVCGMHRALCICSMIPKLKLRTKVTLVVHAKELKRTTNTGRLALQALVNSEMRVRGEGREALNLSDLLSDEFESLLFYPSEDALELGSFVVGRRPIQLIVPDGNWRQAGKVHLRHPELRSVQRVKITIPNLAAEHLRKEHFSEGMSTLEAIAKALAILEGEAVGEEMMALYAAKLSATLLGREGGLVARADSPSM